MYINSNNKKRTSSITIKGFNMKKVYIQLLHPLVNISFREKPF